MNSSSTSTARWRNSSINNGSTSVDTGDRNRRLQCRSEKRTVDGLTSGKYITDGLGVGYSR